MWRLKTEYDHGHIGSCALLVEHTETWVGVLCLTKAHEDKQRTNDINANSDGPTWIQTATGGDKPRTAGGTPTANFHTTPRTTEAKRGR